MTTSRVCWYFDVVSPFAYLHSERFDALFAGIHVQIKPVLFAGLLEHYGNVGPAEIPVKRRVTFERIAWLAHVRGVPLRLPPAHPFNPIPLLRFVIAAGQTREAMHAAFRFVWQEGRLPSDEAALAALLHRFGLTLADINAAQVKEALRENGAQAIAQGVFGVPTTCVGEWVFWGDDATDMVQAALRGDPFFTSAAWSAAHELPMGLQRRR